MIESAGGVGFKELNEEAEERREALILAKHRKETKRKSHGKNSAN